MTQWFALLLSVALVLGACGDTASSGDTSPVRRPLTVLAAASLTEVLPQLSANDRYQFGGSNELATQVQEGAAADLLVAANARIPKELHDAGLVDEPVAFASNRIVMVVPEGSKLSSLEALVADADAKIVMAGEGVPVGACTRDVLAALDASALVQRSASFERDVKAVTSKVVLGEADAGFVYVTDAAAADDDVDVVELPPSGANHTTYMVAVVAASRHRAQAAAYVKLLTSARGRTVLAAAGFGEG